MGNLQGGIHIDFFMVNATGYESLEPRLFYVRRITKSTVGTEVLLPGCHLNLRHCLVEPVTTRWEWLCSGPRSWLSGLKWEVFYYTPCSGLCCVDEGALGLCWTWSLLDFASSFLLASSPPRFVSVSVTTYAVPVFLPPASEVSASAGAVAWGRESGSIVPGCFQGASKGWVSPLEPGDHSGSSRFRCFR